MKLKKIKLYFYLGYLAFGTIIFITVSIIVASNFFRDASLFASPVVNTQTEVSTQAKPTATPDKEKVAENHQPTPTTEKAEPTPEENTQTEKKIKVQVVNYTGITNLAEDIRTLLESEGYEVSAGNGTSGIAMKTEIIVREDADLGLKIRNLIKSGTVSVGLDPNSRFDAAVIIGDDYIP